MRCRGNKFTFLLSLFLSLAIGVQGPAIAQAVVDISLPITITARITTYVNLVNLALVADAVVVSSGDGGYINDGDPNTLWVSGDEANSWVEYRWDEPQRVNEIVIESVEGATTVDILITDSDGNIHVIDDYVIPPDGMIPFEDTIENVTSIKIIFNNAGPVSVGEIGVYYDSNLENEDEDTYPSSNYIQIRDGYFFNPVTNSPWIPRGIVYQISVSVTGIQRPPGELNSDLEMMAGIGVDAIRVDFVWGQIETESGRYEDGFVYYDTLLEVAKDKGIKVFPIIGWQYPPSWAPGDWYSVDSDGRRANVISFENSVVQEKLRDFIQAVVRRYSEGGERQDLGDTIAAWILGNGFSYLDPISLRYIGYDPDSREAFSGGEEYALIEWREQSIADFVKLAARAVRDVDTGHLITYASIGLQYGEEDWGYSSEDAKKIKDACDAIEAPLSFWSINNYPWAQENNELITGQWPIEKVRRDTGLPIMITETGFTTTDGIVEISEARQARLVRNAIWEALESGAIGVCVYHWDDRDIPGREGGFGIVSLDRTPKPAYSAVQDVFTKMRELNIADYLINSTVPTPDIAFLWDDAVDTTINRYKAEMGALFGTLERLGYEPSFVDELISLDPSYRALVLPRTQRMFDSTFDLLGGLSVNVHADGEIPGLMNEYGERQDDRIPTINYLFGIDADEIRPPALVFWDGRAISLNDPDINTWTWADRYNLIKSIYTDEGGFNIQPQLNVSNKYILADYRITNNGSLLLSLRNYRADRVETTTVRSDLMQNRTISDLLTSVLIEENCDGEIVRTLEPDGHSLILAYTERKDEDDIHNNENSNDDSKNKTEERNPEEDNLKTGEDPKQNNSNREDSGSDSGSGNYTPDLEKYQDNNNSEDNFLGYGGAYPVFILEGDEKKKTKKGGEGEIKLTENTRVANSSRDYKRSYRGTGMPRPLEEENRINTVHSQHERDLPSVILPPMQQSQDVITGYKEIGRIRVEPKPTSEKKAEEIRRPSYEIEKTKAVKYPNNFMSIMNGWIGKFGKVWKDMFNSIKFMLRRGTWDYIRNL